MDWGTLLIAVVSYCGGLNEKDHCREQRLVCIQDVANDKDFKGNAIPGISRCLSEPDFESKKQAKPKK